LTSANNFKRRYSGWKCPWQDDEVRPSQRNKKARRRDDDRRSDASSFSSRNDGDRERQGLITTPSRRFQRRHLPTLAAHQTSRTRLSWSTHRPPNVHLLQFEWTVGMVRVDSSLWIWAENEGLQSVCQPVYLLFSSVFVSLPDILLCVRPRVSMKDPRLLTAHSAMFACTDRNFYHFRAQHFAQKGVWSWEQVLKNTILSSLKLRLVTLLLKSYWLFTNS